MADRRSVSLRKRTGWGGARGQTGSLGRGGEARESPRIYQAFRRMRPRLFGATSFWPTRRCQLELQWDNTSDMSAFVRKIHPLRCSDNWGNSPYWLFFHYVDIRRSTISINDHQNMNKLLTLAFEKVFMFLSASGHLPQKAFELKIANRPSTDTRTPGAVSSTRFVTIDARTRTRRQHGELTSEHESNIPV